MTKEVVISLKGTQYSEGETDIEIIYSGVYYYKNGLHYIGYKEVSEDGDTTKNMIKVAHDFVEITRNGIVQSKMRFIENTRTTSPYNTPFGVLIMDIETEKLNVIIEEDYIETDMRYTIIMDGEKASECDMCIKVKSV